MSVSGFVCLCVCFAVLSCFARRNNMWVFTGPAVSCTLRSMGTLDLKLLTACKEGGGSEMMKRGLLIRCLQPLIVLNVFLLREDVAQKRGSAWFVAHHKAGERRSAVVNR